MAKVKIQGHASGSGVLTVTAPNTSSDRTITLPDSTDTLIGAATTDALTTRINATGGRKNMLINGAMTVYQRGTVNTVDGSNLYSLDRWKNLNKGGAISTLTQATDVPANQGFGYSHKIDVTTADAMGTATDECSLKQQIEAQDVIHIGYGTSTCQTVTLSFWIKSTITGTYIAELHRHDTDRFLSTAYTVSVADTWEKKTITYAADTTGVVANDTGSGLMVQLHLAAGSNYTSGTLGSWNTTVANRAVGQVNAMSSTSNNIYFTGVQLELGSVATDFEHRSYGEELALCQRYCWMPCNADTGSGKHLINGYFWGVNEVDVGWEFPVEMRAAPTLIQTTGNDYFQIQNSSSYNLDNAWSIQQAHKWGANCYQTPESNGTAGNSGNIVIMNANARFGFNAEL